MEIKNRSRMDIYYDILTAARRSVRKTHIMYRSNLSYKQLDIYLTNLVRNNLIEEVQDDDARVYIVTSRGLNFIELFEDISKYLSPDSMPAQSEQLPAQTDFIEKQPFVY